MPTFTTPDPIDVHIDIVGDARITASDRTDTVVVVRPRDPSKSADVTAADRTVVEFSDGRLRVATAKHWTRHTPFGGGESIELRIELPTGSRVEGSSGLGDLHADGELGDCRFKTAMGNIRLDHTGALRASTAYGNVIVDRIAGHAEVTTSSGEVRVGAVAGTAVIKNSNGDSELGEVTGDVRVKAGNGDISIGRAHASVVAKNSNGDVRVGDVRRGTIVVETAVGELEVGVHAGTAAWLDLNARYGAVRNDLEAADGPEPSGDSVEVRARSSYGDIVIRRSTDDRSTRST